MSSYSGRHAELYDLFYADKPYGQEAAFVDRCLRRHMDCEGRRLLEMACGTGTHALLLEAAGWDVSACDHSTDMLAQAQRKASSASSHVQFSLQDIRSLDIPGEPFDAATCLFDSIGYVATNDAVAEVLRGVHGHLRAGGLFVFEFWHAAAMLRSYEPVRFRRFESVDGHEIIRIAETTLECMRQLAGVKYTVVELRGDGTYDRFVEMQTNRYFLVPEMQTRLEIAGFTPLQWFAGFFDDERIDETTWHVVAIARRKQGPCLGPYR